MIYQHEEKWRPLVALLAPLLATASDDDLRRPIDPLQRGGSVWQGTFLALGNAYEHLGDRPAAEASYERISRLAGARKDWTFNRTLVYLGRLRQARGDVAGAAAALADALDVTVGFDTPVRRQFETDTSDDLDRVIETARRQGTLADLARASDALVTRSPRSAGAWYLRGLIFDAMCEGASARQAYDRAAALGQSGAGAFLPGRRSAITRTGCADR